MSECNVSQNTELDTKIVSSNLVVTDELLSSMIVS
jgi:hypothetical protein